MERYESSDLEQQRLGRLYALQDERDHARTEYYKQIDRTHQKRIEREEATDANPAVLQHRRQRALQQRREYIENNSGEDLDGLNEEEINEIYWRHRRVDHAYDYHMNLGDAAIDDDDFLEVYLKDESIDDGGEDHF